MTNKCAKPEASDVKASPALRRCYLLELGQADYLETWNLQKQLVAARHNNAVDDLLIILEHPHTYTTGRAGKDANILFDDTLLQRIGATFYRTDRGGDITYHGPGQLVAYPIIDLRRWNPDIHKYLRSLEEVVIRTLNDFGIVAERVPGATGIWVGNEKIAAIGVHVTRWVTSHGFALNINTDLSYFGNIIPCGLRGKGVTSMAKICGKRIEPDLVVRHLLDHFAEEFQVRIERCNLAYIEEVVGLSLNPLSVPQNPR